jgi:hypothetical protein
METFESQSPIVLVLVKMAMTDNFAKTVTRFGKVIMMVGFFAWIGYINLGFYYCFSRPTSPQTDADRLYPFEEHGHVAYLTHRETENLHLARDTAASLFGVGICLAIVVKIRERSDAQNQLS